MKVAVRWTATLFMGTVWNVSASAVLTVNHTAAQPTDNVIVSHTAASSVAGYEIRYITTNAAATQWRRDGGQCFLASTNFVMQSFSMRLWSDVTEVASEAPFTLRVYESATEPAGTLTGPDALGSLIFTQSANWLSSASGASSNSWVTFDVGNNVICTAGKYYTVFFNFESQSDGMTQWFYTQQNGTYEYGRAKAAVDATAIASSRFTDISTDRDFLFVVQARAPTLKLIIIH